MRKDTRIGVAIGLVLFAVLIAYAVVGNKTPSSKKKVTLDTTGKSVGSPDDFSARGSGSSLDARGSAAGEGQEAAAGNTAATPLSAVETSDPSASGASSANWEALLSGKDKDAAIHTKTPDMDRGTAIDPGSSKRSSGGADTAGKLAGGPTGNSKTADNAAHNTAIAGTHRVEQGETFVSIARAVYGDGRYASDIAKANPNIDPRRMRPGATLQLPDKAQVIAGTAANNTPGGKSTPAPAKTPAINAGKEYAVQAEDSLYKISVKVFGKGDKVDAIYELNKQQIGPDPARLKPGMILKLPQSAGAPLTTVTSAAR